MIKDRERKRAILSRICQLHSEYILSGCGGDETAIKIERELRKREHDTLIEKLLDVIENGFTNDDALQ